MLHCAVTPVHHIRSFNFITEFASGVPSYKTHVMGTIVTAIHELYGRGKGTNYTYCMDWRPVNNHDYLSKKTHSFALGELKTQNAFCQNMFSQVS